MNNQDKTPQGITPNLPLWSYQLQQDSKLAVRTRKELEINLITRALKDEDFRQELIANPKAVVEKELGAKLPEELEIKVLEETEDALYMVLPCNPYKGMSEEELQASLGMTYEDVAQWVLEEQRNTLLDEESSVRLVAQAWRNGVFKQELLANPSSLINEELAKENYKELQSIQIQIFEETVNTLFILVPKLLKHSELDIYLENSKWHLLEVNLPGVPGSYEGCPRRTGPIPRDESTFE